MAGEPKKRDALIRAPLAGLMNASSSGSVRAIDTPPMARFKDGKMSNWSAWASGTVRIEMSWAEAGPARVTRRADKRIKRRGIRHHPAGGTLGRRFGRKGAGGRRAWRNGLERPVG